MNEKNKTLSFRKTVLIITTTVFSFSSSTTAFFSMGLNSLVWLALAALFYFIPFALINSEFTSAYPNSKGSLYHWISDNLSKRLAFTTTFVWYSSYFIWMMSLFLKLWIPFSIILFGYDISKVDSIYGMSTKWILTVLSIIGILLLTWIIKKGFLRISKWLVMGGLLMSILVAITIISNLIISFYYPDQIIPNIQSSINNGNFFENNKLTGFASQLPFFIFAITAFGGLDTISSLVDKVGNQKNKFSKAILVGGILVFIIYFLDILTWSMGNNFNDVHAQTNQHLGNLMYGLMDVLSLKLASVLQLSPSITSIVNQLFIRYTALTLFISYIALLATIGYAPLKVLIQGGERKLFPKFLLKENKYGVLNNAVNIQAIIISVFVITLSLGTPFVSSLYNQLTLMTNLSRSLPYLLIAFSYPFFKAKFKGSYMQLINGKILTFFLMFSVVTCVVLAILFEIYSTYVSSGIINVVFLIAGPLLAAMFANYIYNKRVNKIS